VIHFCRSNLFIMYNGKIVMQQMLLCCLLRQMSTP